MGRARAVGPRLARLRKARGLSQRALGDESGVSFGHIARIEKGERSPSVETIRLLAGALGVSAYYLETGDEGGDLIYVEKGASV
jgi:transcriptional regulator with XRE-family HTH domain